MIKKEEGRKTRSDKKIDVKPTISKNLKNQLYTFAFLCNEPVKDVAERLCIRGATSKVIIEEICQWFRRDYLYKNTLVIGDPNRKKLKIHIQGESAKVTIRFKQNDYDLLCKLAHALDLTPTTTAAVLIRMTLYNVEFMQKYAYDNLSQLSDERKKKIEVLLKKMWKGESD
ncbi:hypothetical protein [Ureibacillus sp. FSL K6-2830]|uniref:hypothetical protein n=1 Tax=Ureibacillus sp. FSL K6-2830 TaxID=2954610 RepID=UPI0030F65889